MMVERHYDDETLIALLESERADTDGHLPSCTVCNEKLDSFRMISGALHDADVWDSREIRLAPVPATIANLRAFADRMSSEDATAAQILPELLAGAREEWMPRLRDHPEWWTAGVVRGLVARMRQQLPVMPPDGVEMTLMATVIADVLRGDERSAQLRSIAWRERAYALFYVGRFSEALAGTERAQLEASCCVSSDYEQSRIDIVRALVLRAMEQIPAAMTAIRRSRETLSEYGDLTRIASATLAETHLLFSRGDFAAAVAILEPLELRLRWTDDADTHSRVLGNLGYGVWKLGRHDEAIRYHETAAILHTELGVKTDAARARWNVASILASVGRTDEAFARFSELKQTFEEFGMISEAALVSLDIAELALARNDFHSVESVCHAAMRSFQAAGISYTARALTALAYIQEAARMRTATPQQVRHVQQYLRRLPREGQLLFAPLPE
jgi:tetratricopeptide (TPR) repeat protein